MSDDGPGKPERIGRFLKRRVSSKGAERGVGLALVKRQVEALGGVISVGRARDLCTIFCTVTAGRKKDQPMINVLVSIMTMRWSRVKSRRYVAQISGFSLLWNRFDAGEKRRVYLQQ